MPEIRDLEEAIRCQFPDVSADGLVHLGSGWEFNAYLTRDRWVFRFPRRSEGAELLRREAALLDLLRPALTPRVAVPQIEHIGGAGPAFPWSFAAHRLIEGVALDDPAAPRHSELAGQIGWVLSRIHSIPPGDALAVGAELRVDGSREWMEEAESIAVELLGLEPGLDGAIEWLRSGPPAPEEFQGEPRLIHNDLCPDHVLVSPRTGELRGLIDWTDAAISDPVLDFLFLVTWGGWSFAESVLDSYTVELAAGFRERLLFLARVASLVWLAEAVERGSDVAKHVRWVINAFATFHA